MISLKVLISKQELYLLNHETILKTYAISTGKKGAGEMSGSEQTPRGWHIIRAKIGKDCPLNSVFVARRPTGEIYSAELKAAHPERDWILTRILWLSGLEPGKNRLGQVDTMQRFIYIHGTAAEDQIGQAASKGCIRMRNSDMIELFTQVSVGTRLLIQE